MRFSRSVSSALALVLMLFPFSARAETYAEKLGWKPGDRVVIFHCDDAGMSHSSNAGAIEGLEKGMVTSVSVMTPCSWVPEFARYLEKHPQVDAGLHLTLTSEWDLYRWGPVAGKPAVPGLVDKEGCLWDNVDLVTKHATPDEVEKEIRAQVDRARTMGMPITHLDSHMGTLFASKEFFERMLKVAMETKTPVLAVGGHMTLVTKGNPDAVQTLKGYSEKIWNAGLPVIDDIFAETYDWKTQDKTALFADLLKNLKPGITEIIVHCTRPTEEFPLISPSTDTRLGDLNAMCDPVLKKLVKDEHILLTTWRELKERRDKVAAGK
ncbi:MAG: polysaccharide deacetylase family protein [Candidatus Hydrogenedentes bacterium]|nr:polysaccharide deacetylase family protein [Candidatus Hydrogenedentota bacterium]